MDDNLILLDPQYQQIIEIPAETDDKFDINDTKEREYHVPGNINLRAQSKIFSSVSVIDDDFKNEDILDEFMSERSGAGNTLFLKIDYDQFKTSNKMVPKKDFRLPFNEIISSKFTVFNFLFLSLFENIFFVTSNAYFLAVLILQLIFNLGFSVYSSTLIPWIICVVAGVIKDGIEDYEKHVLDNEINHNCKSRILNRKNPHFVEIDWADINPGDIIMLRNNEQVPADFVILSSSDEQGVVYTDIANLGGDTNLVIKHALESTQAQELNNSDRLYKLKAKIRYEALDPNTLDKFEGYFRIAQGRIPISIQSENVVHRGSTIRNTTYACGVVVFTGYQTRASIANSHTVSKKQSKIQKKLSRYYIVDIGLIFIMCVINVVLSAKWNISAFSNHSYLYIDLSSFQVILHWFHVFLFYCNAIPIMLQISMDIVKFFQAKQITKTIKNVSIQTSSVLDSLGSVDYVFVDKTGTLTASHMAFKSCAVGGFVYGYSDKERTLTSPASSFKEENIILHPAETTSISVLKRGTISYKFQDKEFLNDMKSQSPQAALINEFCLIMALCHNVNVQKDENGQVTGLLVSSPDEGALVKAASNLGYEFITRKHKKIILNVHNKITSFQVLNVNDFSADRRRMSIVVRLPNGSLVLYVKGAEDVIFDLLRPDQAAAKDILFEQLANYSSQGLRCLCMAKRALDPSWYEDWNIRYEKAKSSVLDRDLKLTRLATEVEHDLELLGASAIEDRLQSKVPESMSLLIGAGCKVWMVTGDKFETAISIGYSSHMITPSSDIIRIDEATRERTLTILTSHVQDNKSYIGQTLTRLVLIISSRSLSHILPSYDCITAYDDLPIISFSSEVVMRDNMPNDDIAIRLFKLLCEMCQCVIAYRLFPSQKALLVKFVKEKVSSNPITVAIGDGANDIPMLREADVGIAVVNVNNHESNSLQVASFADIVISDFAWITNLFFNYGFFNYQFLALLILYSFYKNIVLIGSSFFYGWFNGFSGDPLHDSVMLLGWNLLWTFIPIFVISLARSPDSPQVHPLQYLTHQNIFHSKSLFVWCFNGVAHAFYILLCVLFFAHTFNYDLLSCKLIVSHTSFLVVTFKLLLHTYPFLFTNIAIPLSFLFSFILYYVTFIIYSSTTSISYSFYHEATFVFSLPSFWLGSLLFSLIPIIVDIFVLYSLDLFYTSRADLRDSFFSLPHKSTVLDPRIVHRLQSVDNASHYGFDDPKSVSTDTMVVRRRQRHDSGAMIELTSFSSPDDQVSGLRSQFPPRVIRSLYYLKELFYTTQHRDDGNDEYLQAKIERLATLKPGNESKKITRSNSSATITGVQNGEITCNPFTLNFQGSPDAKIIEYNYYQNFISKYHSFARISLIAVYAIFLLYGIIIAIAETDYIVHNYPYIILLAGFLLILLILVLSRYFRKYFTMINMLFLFIGSVLIILLLNNVRNSLILALYIIFAFLVFRSKFIHSFIISIFALIFYNIYNLTFTEASFSGYHLFGLNLVLILITYFSGYTSQDIERLFRKDYLLKIRFLQQQEETQTVLNHLLPLHITHKIRTLQQQQQHDSTLNVSSHESCVSIIFCDVINFNSFISDFSAIDAIQLLDGIYTMIDELCEKQHVQKMETVGKTYMACAGLQGTRKDHALACVELAEDIIDLLNRLNSSYKPQQSNKATPFINIRIGIHSGEVITGIVGRDRPQFCLFGDTVNTASRMQSTGEPFRIHISQATHDLLGNSYTYERRQVDVHGKGLMTTFFVGDCLILYQRRRNRRLSLRPLDDDTMKEVNTVASSLLSSESVSIQNIYRLDVFSLKFVEPEKNYSEATLFMNIPAPNELEKGFGTYLKKTAVSSMKKPILLMVLLHALLTVFNTVEYFFYDSLNTPKPDFSFTNYLIFISLYLGYAFISVIYYFIHDKSFISPYSIAFACIYFYLDLVIILISPFIYSFENLTVLLHTLMYFLVNTIISNVISIRYIHAVIFNFVGFALFIIFFIFTCNYGLEGGCHYEFLFYAFVNLLINIISSYGREVTARREYVFLLSLTENHSLANDLLYKMLPPPVAQEVKERNFLANEFDGVAILYSDIEGFTRYASSHSADTVVQILHNLFMNFDQLTCKHSVYKIQTIGDAYVLVGGLPFSASADNKNDGKQDQLVSTNVNKDPYWNSLNCVEMGFDMIRSARSSSIRLRVGIHVGHIIAGCIGQKSLRYDIWGSDVLIANNMEARGVPGKVCVSGTVIKYLSRKYNYTKHKNVLIKGTEEITSFLIDLPENSVEIKEEIVKAPFTAKSMYVPTTVISPTIFTPKKESSQPLLDISSKTDEKYDEEEVKKIEFEADDED